MSFSTMKEFAHFIFDMLKSDRDVIIAVSGFTGEGKSCWSTQLQQEYARISNTEWNFKDNITWAHQEFVMWIEGKGDELAGRKPEYSAILSDELITMFYRRNWHEDPQIESIRLLNMCRDRHLLIVGNIPNFFDLDSGFAKRIRYYVYIPERGRAWVFEQENNPFNADSWNVNDNKKIFRKQKNPYRCPNFVCEIPFSDWNPKEKEAYYKVRNTKRIGAERQRSHTKNARISTVVKQRDAALRMLYENYKVTLKELKSITGLSMPNISRAINGQNTRKGQELYEAIIQEEAGEA